MDGRSLENLGLILFAFLNPVVHQASWSAELVELIDVLLESPTVERSRALRFFRSPTFSVFGSVHDRSAENMLIAAEILRGALTC